MRRCCATGSTPTNLTGVGTGGFAAYAAGAVFLAWSALLCVFDIRERRLPDALTGPPAVAALTACLWQPSLAWGLLWPTWYLLVGRGIGGGDIKLAVPLGVACAAAGGPLGVVAAFGLSGLFTVGVAVVFRKRSVPHGPSMLCALWVLFPFLCMYSGV
ncbi:A24 family peptidase [Corynebacterium afermentans]|uniref:A24 family peptidase n=1 Tax=Corynebacterium afermentans TaxID=38286 RepID=UPI003307B16D